VRGEIGNWETEIGNWKFGLINRIVIQFLSNFQIQGKIYEKDPVAYYFYLDSINCLFLSGKGK